MHEYVHTWAAPEKEPGQAADKIPAWLCRGRRSGAAVAAAARGRHAEEGGAGGWWAELLEGGVGDGGRLYQTSAVARVSEWAAWEADSPPPPSVLGHEQEATAVRGGGTGTAGRRRQESETEVRPKSSCTADS